MSPFRRPRSCFVIKKCSSTAKQENITFLIRHRSVCHPVYTEYIGDDRVDHLGTGRSASNGCTVVRFHWLALAPKQAQWSTCRKISLLRMSKNMKGRTFHSFEDLACLRPRKRASIRRYERVDVGTPLPKECLSVDARLRLQRAEARRCGLGTVTVVTYSAKIFGVWTSIKESELQKYEGFSLRKEVVILDRWSHREIHRSVE